MRRTYRRTRPRVYGDADTRALAKRSGFVNQKNSLGQRYRYALAVALLEIGLTKNEIAEATGLTYAGVCSIRLNSKDRTSE